MVYTNCEGGSIKSRLSLEKYRPFFSELPLFIRPWIKQAYYNKTITRGKQGKDRLILRAFLVPDTSRESESTILPPELQARSYKSGTRRNIMEIHQSISEGVTILALIGRLDTTSTSEFEEHSRALPAGPIILDLSRLEYISSSGLRVFLQLKRDCVKKNIPIVFAGSWGSVAKVIRVSGFENIFSRYPSVADALLGVAAEGAGS